MCPPCRHGVYTCGPHAGAASKNVPHMQAWRLNMCPHAGTAFKHVPPIQAWRAASQHVPPMQARRLHMWPTCRQDIHVSGGTCVTGRDSSSASGEGSWGPFGMCCGALCIGEHEGGWGSLGHTVAHWSLCVCTAVHGARAVAHGGAWGACCGAWRCMGR
eukprot:242600-Chlamydomonas_euryale.AAC.1